MNINEGIKVHGFCRVQLNRNGKIEGDSGWVKNQITNEGFLNFLVKLIGASSGSSQIGFMAVGTGGAPASNATTLPNEVMSSTKRKAVTFSNVASTTAQFTASWASNDISAAYTINNVGLFAATTTNATLFAGQSYTSSQWNTDQDLNATYQIRFS